MNKFYLFIVFIMSATFFVEGCDTSADEAVHFFDKVHKPVESCIEQEEVFHQQVDVFFDFVSEGDTNQVLQNTRKEIEKLKTQLSTLQQTSVEAKTVLDSLAVWEGGESLYRAAMNVVDAYLGLVRNELVEMVKLMELPPKEDDEDWYKKMDHLLYLLDSKVGERMEIFEQEAYEYAQKNGIELYEEE